MASREDKPIDSADTLPATGDAFVSTIPPPRDDDLAIVARVERYVC